MGTRTWSRKGVLTAAGRRRAGIVGQELDIFGDPIPDSGTPAPAPVPMPAAIVAPPPIVIPAPKKTRAPKAPAQPAPPVTPTAPTRPTIQLDDGRTTVITPADFQKNGELYDVVDGMALGTPVRGTPQQQNDGVTTRGLAKIYEMQGFNGQPQTFDTEKAFFQHVESGQVLTHPDGTPILLARSTPRPEFMDDFISGPVHRANEPGYFGSGTYMAGTFGSSSTLGRPMMQARTADGKYSPYADLGWQVEHVVRKYGSRYMDMYGKTSGLPIQTTTRVMALSKSARTNLTEIADSSGRYSPQGYDRWLGKVNREFKQRFGFNHPNVAVQAAALGYDAVLMPYDGIGGKATSNEFIVLNRGVVKACTADSTPRSITRNMTVPAAKASGVSLTPSQSTGRYQDARGQRH